MLTAIPTLHPHHAEMQGWGDLEEPDQSSLPSAQSNGARKRSNALTVIGLIVLAGVGFAFRYQS